MIDVDLLITNIGQLVTVGGTNAPRTGRALRSLGIVEDAAVAGKGGVILAAGRRDEIERSVSAVPDGVIDAGGATVTPMWLVLTYFLHVVGEMCLSPVGLSTVTKLAPARATSLMMGVWFLAAAVGNYLGGRAASLYETLELPTLFGIVAAVPIAAGILLALLVPQIRKLMGGVH